VVGLVAFYTGLGWVQCLFFALALGWTGGLGGGAWGCFIFQMKMNSLRSDTIFFIEK
jgi:hypothetical protein